jgi:hypothetical protein
MLPKNYNGEVLFEAIDSILESGLTSEEYYYLVHESAKYAVRVKNRGLLNTLKFYWDDLKEELSEEQNEKIRSLFDIKV